MKKMCLNKSFFKSNYRFYALKPKFERQNMAQQSHSLLTFFKKCVWLLFFIQNCG